MRRLIAVERLGGVLGGRDLAQHVERLRARLLVDDVGADARIVHAAGLRMARIVEHRLR